MAKMVDIENLVMQLNRGRNRAVARKTIGDYVICSAYGGHELHQIVNSGGGVRVISTGGYVSKPKIYDAVLTLVDNMPPLEAYLEQKKDRDGNAVYEILVFGDNAEKVFESANRDDAITQARAVYPDLEIDGE